MPHGVITSLLPSKTLRGCYQRLYTTTQQDQAQECEEAKFRSWKWPWVRSSSLSQVLTQPRESSSHGQNCCEASAGLGSRKPFQAQLKGCGQTGKAAVSLLSCSLDNKQFILSTSCLPQGSSPPLPFATHWQIKWTLYNTWFLQAHSLPQHSAGRNA